MNNSNGAALLARVKPGDLVTVRRPDGGQSTGRAVKRALNVWDCDGRPKGFYAGAHNIIRIQSKD